MPAVSGRVRRLLCWYALVLACFFGTLMFLFQALDVRVSSLRIDRQGPPVKHRLCVLVPYRDRANELDVFVPHMHQFLSAQNVEYRILVLNQTDSYRFNRASLINVGWYESRLRKCDYMVMHDVDLLPLNPQLDYRYPEAGPRHIASPDYHPKYNYTKFIGGILMLTVRQYESTNGMSNKYWGWGLEDDEFYLRLRDAQLLDVMERPGNLTTDRTNTFRHVHNSGARRRDYAKSPQQRQMSRKRDRISGLNNLKYRIVGIRYLKYDTASNEIPPVIVLDVELHCDLNWTPYCVPMNQKPAQSNA